MKRFKNILLVLRELHNERGIERAVNLAKMNDARLTLIRTHGQLTKGLEIFRGLASFGRLARISHKFRASRQRNSADTRRARISAVGGIDIPCDAGIKRNAVAVEFRKDSPKGYEKCGLQDAGVGKTQDELTALCESLDMKGARGVIASAGSPCVAIVRQVLRHQHDLVITTAQGDPASAGGLFHSLSLHLIRKCPCPVWVVHPENPRRGGQVLAAVDPTATDPDGSVDSQILDLAISLSQLDQAKLHIVHAYNALKLERQENLFPKYAMTSEELRKCTEEAIDKRRRQLEAMLLRHPLDSVEHEIHFVNRFPSVLVPQVANEHRVDVIVLGTVSHPSPIGHCIGTTAEDIINQIGCSVLTVKPQGFVSPIKL